MASQVQINRKPSSRRGGSQPPKIWPSSSSYPRCLPVSYHYSIGWVGIKKRIGNSKWSIYVVCFQPQGVYTIFANFHCFNNRQTEVVIIWFFLICSFKSHPAITAKCQKLKFINKGFSLQSRASIPALCRRELKPWQMGVVANLSHKMAVVLHAARGSR